MTRTDDVSLGFRWARRGEGGVYDMQSYSVQQDKASLAKLGEGSWGSWRLHHGLAESIRATNAATVNQFRFDTAFELHS